MRPAEATKLVLEHGHKSAGVHIHLANAYTTTLANRSRTYREMLNDGVTFADGKPIAWISRLKRHTPLVSQVRGPQLFVDVLDQGRRADTRHFLLGATPEVLTQLERRLRQMYPGIQIAGSYSPPFRPPTQDDIRKQDGIIRASRCDIVWVGLGTPKQDFEAARIARDLRLAAVAVGAAFDFAAGAIATAPAWMRALGLEWLFRLSTEPRRLWRRYLIGNFQFLRLAARDIFRTTSSPISSE